MAATYTTQQIQDLITQTALQYGVSPALALAVAQTESNFNPNAVSPTNSNGTTDYGVFQINSSNLASLGLSNPTDPVSNINAGIQMLAQLSQQYNGNTQQILWAYNAGPGAVASGNLPQSTASYISLVNANMANWSGTLPDLTDTSGDSGDTTDGTINILGMDVDPTVAAIGGAGILLLAWYLAR
jgi:soluble lytic murein transglycosylase-like protein